MRAHPARFELVAASDLDPARLGAFAARFAVDRTYADAEAMLAAERPDVLCFATPPRVRLSLVELGVKHGVRALAFEKPLALSLAEGRRIVDLCAAAGVRAVVCHQLKFGAHWQKARALVTGGEIGEVRLLHATGRPSVLRVGTHLIDHVLWLHGGPRAVWVLGQADGRQAYAEDHPCPDHLGGVVAFADGARAIVECGTLAPHLRPPEDFWGDAGVTVYGTAGWVRVVVGGGWEAVTRTSGGRTLAGPGDTPLQEPAFYAALADWLDDPARAHPSSLETAYRGFEILIGLALSSLERRCVELPIVPVPREPVLARLEHALGVSRSPA